METQESHLDQINEIRKMMERSSKFISLSGIAGVWVGFVALAGMLMVYLNYKDFVVLQISGSGSLFIDNFKSPELYSEFLNFLFIDALIILIVAVLGAAALTILKSTKRGLSVWDHTTKRFIISMLVPLSSGGILVFVLANHGYLEMVRALTLVFYGLALFNAGRYSLIEIRYLGLMEILLGLFASVFWQYSALMWGLGFGIMHIIYGVVMYFKYDRK